MHATPHSDPVYKITIIPRGQSGGFTMALPVQDSILMFRNQIRARIIGLMGGRVAEEVFCHDITSGASNDLQVATQLAEDMVMRLGMSVSGLRVFNRPQGTEALMAPRAGQKTFEVLDEAINQILEEGYEEAKRIINAQRSRKRRLHVKNSSPCYSRQASSPSVERADLRIKSRRSALLLGARSLIMSQPLWK
jgi:cell division protease FtsH